MTKNAQNLLGICSFLRVFCNLFFARSLGCVLVFSGVLRLFWRVVSYDKTITPPHYNMLKVQAAFVFRQPQ